MAISDNPSKGDSIGFDYIGGETHWIVPIDGYYDIYCYGACGGLGDTDNRPGNKGKIIGEFQGGDARGSRVLLRKGTDLIIHVGMKPSNVSISVGEGSTNGQNWHDERYQYVNGYEVYYVTEGFPGEYSHARGWSDGQYGTDKKTICDSDGDHSGGAVGGGGGGSSYIVCNGVKIISAKGGKGQSVHYEAVDGSGDGNGGAGGGGTSLTNTTGVTWLTDKLNITQNATRIGNGYINIVFMDFAFPKIFYNDEKLNYMKYDGEDVQNVYYNGVKL